MQSAAVVSVDPFHRGVFDVVDGFQRAVRNGLCRPMASVLNNPIVVSGSACWPTRPTNPPSLLDRGARDARIVNFVLIA
jgi:hypothetical protein